MSRPRHPDSSDSRSDFRFGRRLRAASAAGVTIMLMASIAGTAATSQSADAPTREDAADSRNHGNHPVIRTEPVLGPLGSLARLREEARIRWSPEGPGPRWVWFRAIAERPVTLVAGDKRVDADARPRLQVVPVPSGTNELLVRWAAVPAVGTQVRLTTPVVTDEPVYAEPGQNFWAPETVGGKSFMWMRDEGTIHVSAATDMPFARVTFAVMSLRRRTLTLRRRAAPDTVTLAPGNEIKVSAHVPLADGRGELKLDVTPGPTREGADRRALGAQISAVRAR